MINISMFYKIILISPTKVLELKENYWSFKDWKEKTVRNNSSSPKAIIYGPNHMASLNNDFGGFKVIICNQGSWPWQIFTLYLLSKPLCIHMCSENSSSIFTRQDADSFKTLARKCLGVGFCTQEQFLEICEIVSLSKFWIISKIFVGPSPITNNKN